MTLAVAWVRKTQNNELWFASDSRLVGGIRWDQCPKIIPFSRGDCGIAFAGPTNYAYPIMLQLFYAAEQNQHISDRAIDINKLKGYILDDVNRLYGSILDSVEKQCYKSNEFIFGGYSSLEKKYRIWKFRFDNSGVKLFTTSPGIKTMLGKKIGPYIVAGDKKKEFKQKLHYFMRDKYGGSFENYSNNGFDTEPLEVLVGMLNESGIEDTIGGAPQIMKVYSFSQAKPIGVYWPYKTKDKRDNRYIMGREVRKEEIIDYRFLNLKTMKTTKTSN